MLDLNPETVLFVIDKAHQFHSKEAAVVVEDGNSTSDWSQNILANSSDDPTYLELKTIIEDLEPDQQVTLVALMWTGRGDFEIGEWAEALAAAGDAWNERSAEYLIGTLMLSDYLTGGLDLHDYPHET